jgi:hypothetical protein
MTDTGGHQVMLMTNAADCFGIRRPQWCAGQAGNRQAKNPVRRMILVRALPGPVERSQGIGAGFEKFSR